MKSIHVLSTSLSILMVVSAISCGPKTPARRFSNWRVIELRDELGSDYDRAWEATVKALVHLKWPVEEHYKDIGYLRTAWVYTTARRSRKRLTIKFPPGEEKDSIEVRTEAQRYESDESGSEWIPASGPILSRRLYFDLVNQLGRPGLTE